MALESQKIITDIRTKGYSTADIELNKQKIHGTMEKFLDFLTLPLEEKSPLLYYTDQEKIGETGYVRKKIIRTSLKSEVRSGDDKEYFHYRQGTEKVLLDRALLLDKKIHLFLDAAREVYNVCIVTAHRVIRTLEHVYPDLYDQFFVHENMYPPVLRFLKYDRHHNDTLLARGHYDRCALTMAIAESSPGLRIGIPGTNEQMKPVKHMEGQVLLFPGQNLKYVTDETLKETWHDVVQEDTDIFAKERDIARWALVMFLNHSKFPPTKNERQLHTRSEAKT